MIRQFPLFQQPVEEATAPLQCQHRTVSPDGQIVCAKISQGENKVSPALCRTCPSRTINCAHLRFSLSLSSSSPLIVRFNGRTEIWNDEPPQLRFRHAACALRVLPILNPSACAACSLHLPLLPDSNLQLPNSQPARVVPFPSREPLAASA